MRTSAGVRNRVRAYNGRMRHSDLIVVQAFGTQAEADLARGVLESAGIDAMIQADTAGRMRPHLAWSGSGFKVLVREEDAAIARDVLKPPHKTSASDFVAVQSFGAEDEADAARGVLESAGIAAMVEADTAGGTGPYLTLIGPGFRVLVPQEDAATAREVLQQFF